MLRTAALVHRLQNLRSMATYADREADRMISSFAWRRRFRNLFGVLFAASALAVLLAFVFRAEIPELDWASESVRSLIGLSQAEEPEYRALAQPSAASDAGMSAPDAMVADSGRPTPPSKDQTSMARGHQLLNEGDAWKALLAFEEASNREPRSPQPFYYMGVSYVQLANYGSAQAMFQRALAVNPNHAASIYGMADALRLSGETHEAVTWYRRYLEVTPNGPNRTAASRAIDTFSK